MFLFLQAPTPQPLPTPTPLVVKHSSGLCPISGVELEKLRAVGRAQVGPGTEVLQKAWSYYNKFKGSWQKGAPKPKPEDVAEFDAFKKELEKTKFPDWYKEILKKAGQPQAITPIYDPTNPGFSAFKQTEETERLKALGIAYLTDHELNRKGSADKGAQVISCLSARTTLDYDLHSLFGRFLLDAGIPPMAWHEVRMGLFLNPAPNKGDLAFVAFAGLIAARDQWGPIQEMLREVATRKEDAEAVIQEWGPRYQGQTKTVITPISK